MKLLYRTYQLLVAAPLFVIVTVVVTILDVIGCRFGNGDFWGYYPNKLWAKAAILLCLLPVKVEGRENLKDGESYVFVSNHQGAFDIFLIYGYLCRNFKWMMKWQISKIPLVGISAVKSNHILVDKRGPKRIKETYDKARMTLRKGMSLVVFPEGARSFTGHMGVFRRGAFMLADEIQLPVVPLTVNGSFDVLPRMRDGKFITWHPLKLTIHAPIYPISQGEENVNHAMKQSYEAIMSGLVPEYQGFVENPDQ